MSYDLYFWREEKDFKITPDKLAEILSKDQHIPGISTFDRKDICNAFQYEFPEIIANEIPMDWEGAGSYFQVFFTYGQGKKVNSIIVICGYLLLESPETMNRIIDVCAKFGCALYDPQTGVRYNQPKILING